MRYLSRVPAALAVIAALTLLTPFVPAQAHGEADQEGFVRMATISFLNTEFGSDSAQANSDGEYDLVQGQEIHIRGTAKVLETWPTGMSEPEVGAMVVAAVGDSSETWPAEVLVNGQPISSSFPLERGDVYDYQLSAVAEQAGRWHVHPVFGVKGSGSLHGPGTYLNVAPNADNASDAEKTGAAPAPGANRLLLWGGGAALAIGLLFWTWRLIVSRREGAQPPTPENPDSVRSGVKSWLSRLALLIAVVGLIATVVVTNWRSTPAPPKAVESDCLHRPAPACAVEQPPRSYAKNAALVPPFVMTEAAGDATYDVEAESLTVTVRVTNLGDTPAKIGLFTAATETWLIGDGSAQLSPSAKIPAGAEKKVELTITDPIWRTAALMPVGESRLQLTGTLVITNGKGGKNYSTIQAFVLPDNF